MKITYINKFFFLNGGSETVFFQERNFMLEQGHEVVDFSMQDERNFSSPWQEYFIPPVSYRKGSLLKRISGALSFVHSGEAVKRLDALLKKAKPDLAHLHNIYHQLTPSIIPVLKKHGVKVLLTLHDGKLTCPSYLMLNRGEPCLRCAGKHFHLPLTINCQNSRFQGAMLCAEAYYHLWRHSYDGVDRFIAPSAFLGEVVAPRIGQKKLFVLRNGMDLQKYIPTYEDEKYILFLGRLSAEKGVGTLLKAHASLPSAPPLVVVGTGPIEQELRAQAGPNVLFAGYCSGDKLLDYIRKASCLVIPSECYENCPMTVLEGMAFGKPVIASRIGGMVEQINHQETGLLCEPGNAEEFAGAMRTLMQDAALRKRMGEAGRKKVELEYSLHKHNEELLKLYQVTLAEHA